MSPSIGEGYLLPWPLTIGAQVPGKHGRNLLIGTHAIDARNDFICFPQRILDKLA